MTSFSKLTEVLNSSWLQAQAGKRTYDRGGAYYHANTVTKLATTDHRLSAAIQGSQVYQASIWLEQGTPRYACNCEPGLTGAFCKHLVALGLTYLVHREEHLPSTGEFSGYRALPELQRYLQSVPKEQLINLLMDQAQQHAEFAQALSLQALRAGYVDTAALENLVRRALRFEPHSALGRDRARRLQRVADLLEALAHSGNLALAQQLATATLARAGNSSELTDVIGKLKHIAAMSAIANPPSTPQPGTQAF